MDCWVISVYRIEQQHREVMNFTSFPLQRLLEIVSGLIQQSNTYKVLTVFIINITFYSRFSIRHEQAQQMHKAHKKSLDILRSESSQTNEIGNVNI